MSIRYFSDGTYRPEYLAWTNMRSRCNNKKATQYKDYGGRGITVCERWNSFENFYADLGKRPSSIYTLDRENNDKNYEPGNCRWLPAKLQNRNRRALPNKSGLKGVSVSSKGHVVAYTDRTNAAQERLYTGFDFFSACCARKSWEHHAKGSALPDHNINHKE